MADTMISYTSTFLQRAMGNDSGSEHMMDVDGEAMDGATCIGGLYRRV